MRPIYKCIRTQENVVGTSLSVQVKIFPARVLLIPLTGLAYIQFLHPTAPGLSLSRWVYLGQGKNVKNNTASVHIMIPTTKLPNHGGYFHVRIHRKNGYTVENKTVVHYS